MVRAAFAGLLCALLAAAVPAAGGNLSTGAGSAPKLRVIITDVGREPPIPSRGRFALEGAAAKDSGTSSVTPGEGPTRIVNGQSLQSVSGTDFLTGKRGKLVLSFSGVSASAGSNVDIVYGSWHVVPGAADGIYKTWKGGGNWADSETVINGVNHYSVRFEGLITR